MRILLCSVLGEHSNEGGLEVKQGLSRADRSDLSNVKVIIASWGVRSHDHGSAFVDWKR